MGLEAKNLSFGYTTGHPLLQNLSFRLEEGERVGLVGPSGLGKSTLAKLLSGYETPQSGGVFLDGGPLPRLGSCPVQLIHQHPEQAVNPRCKMRQVLEEAGRVEQSLLEAMGIDSAWLDRYPRELSGGELQRFCVARTLGGKLRFLVADEISAMLDVITQAQIWSVVLEEVRRRRLGLVVITHNLELATRICTRVVDIRDLLSAASNEKGVVHPVKLSESPRRGHQSA